MRVAFVAMVTAYHEETPATRRTRRIARHLAAGGHDVTVLCSQWWEGTIPEFEHEDVLYRAVTDDPSAKAFASKLPFALKRSSPDVVHAVNTPPSGVVAAKTTARLLRVPVVVDWWSEGAGSPANYRRAARKADAVVTPSETVRTQVREYGADADDVRVIPESVDLSLVRDAPVDDRFDVVYARHLDEAANVEGFLLALAELREKGWSAAVVGDGPERERAERTARDLRIDDRVDFLGSLSDEARVSVLKGAHVFAQTATHEAFPTNLLWALAAGCVGIVEYQAGSSAHELVEGRERGRLVTNPQELADEIVAARTVERLPFDESFASFDHGEILEQYLACYRDVVDDYGFF
ncbi:Glycosyltransferase involved in cell wall bisynthesis [Halogranum rubrum]|uniref:Glycosyltransferase involved in cell wall bisynthesis n=2 Tax=Halogranum rubrum TaxID=553466 RepID=A0A1I4EDD2_9EURY|nr:MULTISPECIES: glycosyltransferase [Halogranum]EJN60552.1 glycosyltransferase [Halogranum salarium B-1]SFL03755.1 Glycosyltransferase involved in cell wall bisynthesis [Halogranum rubrum]